MKTPNTGEKPNILIIMSDQHQRAFSGCYGNSIVRTPNIDRLAREGMRLNKCYTPAPVCVPARMSFLTCRTPSRNEVWANTEILSSMIPTWAHHMTAAGYETSLIGRMHFRGEDFFHGFENLPCGDPENIPIGVEPPFDYEKKTPLGGAAWYYVENCGFGRSYLQWLDEERTRAACRYIRAHKENPNRPFAAVVGYHNPHPPYYADPDLVNYYLERIELPHDRECLPQHIIDFYEPWIEGGWFGKTVAPDKRKLCRAIYYALCEILDRNIGEILKTLDETGLAQNTVVIYTSDHGEMAGQKEMWGKNNSFEQSAGIPLIVRWPGHIDSNSKCDKVCNLMDIGPTIVDTAGAAPMKHVDGRSLLPLLAGHVVPEWKNETLVENTLAYDIITFEWQKPTGKTVVPWRLIVSDNWKLTIYWDNGNISGTLYDIDTDPDETNNVYCDSTYEDIKNSLTKKIMRDWDPEFVVKKSIELKDNWDAMVKAGKKRITFDASLVGTPPPYDVEKDVVNSNAAETLAK